MGTIGLTLAPERRAFPGLGRRRFAVAVTTNRRKAQRRRAFLPNGNQYVVTDLSIEGPTSTVPTGGGTVQMVANATMRGGTVAGIVGDQSVVCTLVWASSNPSVGTINSSTGVFTPVAAGSTNITVSSQGVTSPAYAVAVVTPTPTLISLTMTPASTSIPVSQQQQFAVTALWSDGSTSVPPLTFDVTAGGGSISASGLYTAPGAGGSATVRVRNTATLAVSDTSSVTITSAGADTPYYTWDPSSYADQAALIAGNAGGGSIVTLLSGPSAPPAVYSAATMDQAIKLEADAAHGKRVSLVQIGIDRHCVASGGVVFPFDGSTEYCARNLQGSGPMARHTITFPGYLNPYWSDRFVRFPDESEVPSGNSVGYAGWQTWGQPGSSGAIKLFGDQYQGGSRQFRTVIVNGAMRADFHSGGVPETAVAGAWTTTLLWSSKGAGNEVEAIARPVTVASGDNGWWQFRHLYHRVDANTRRFGWFVRMSHLKDGTPISVGTNPWRGQLWETVRGTGVASLLPGINSPRIVESMNSTPTYTQNLHIGPQSFYGGVNGGAYHTDPLGMYAYIGVAPV